MPVWITPYVDVGVNTDIYISGDALGPKATFTNLPERGVIMAVNVIDRDSEAVSLDLVMFKRDIAGTAVNDAFDPSDDELLDSIGEILVSTWKTYSDNSKGIEDNVGLPYWAPGGVITFQCVTRGTPTFTAATDLWVSISIVY